MEESPGPGSPRDVSSAPVSSPLTSFPVGFGINCVDSDTPFLEENVNNRISYVLLLFQSLKEPVLGEFKIWIFLTKLLKHSR